MDNRDTKAILEYHEVTKHSERSVRSNRHVLDWENQPLPLKVYRDLDPIPLVRDFPDKGDSALEAMARTPRPAAGEAEEERIPNLTVLSRVLQLSAGITRSRRHAAGTVYFRAYPNTGALHHVDLYLVVGELPGLSSGVYHFGPQDFALRCLREGDWRGVLVEASGNNPDLARAPVIVVSASTYWRNSWKYQARAWRHCFWDAGTMHANLLAVAETENLEPRLVLGWADRPVERLLALDPMREGALTMVSLGRCLRPPPTAWEADEDSVPRRRMCRSCGMKPNCSRARKSTIQRFARPTLPRPWPTPRRLLPGGEGSQRARRPQPRIPSRLSSGPYRTVIFHRNRSTV